MPVPTPGDSTPSLYQSVDDIETPQIAVDLDAMERNLADYAAFAEEQDVTLRSHIKTHKIPDIAHRQQDVPNAGGIVCQTVGEAETMALAGIEDIYLSYNIVDRPRAERAAWLVDRLDAFATTVDCEAHVDLLETVGSEFEVTFDAIVEVDVGYGRVGVRTPEEAADLASYVADREHVDFAGVMTFEGHVKGQAESKADFERLCAERMDELAVAVDRIEDAGVPVEDVKVGSTSTSKFSGKHPIVTEINPGMYVFNDTGELTVRPWDVTEDDCACTVHATVISVPTDDRMIVDAGSKSISMDVNRLPIAKGRDDIEYFSFSEEHGWIDTSESDTEFAVGDRLEFIVPHVCTSVNLHDTLIGTRDGRVEEVWNVAARGKVR